MVKGISLANKSLLVFGFAVLVILAVSLSVPWIRTHTLVSQYQTEIARQIADAWWEDRLRHGTFEPADPEQLLGIRMVELDDVEQHDDYQFLAAALRAFQEDESLTDFIDTVEVDGQEEQQYARAIRRSKWQTIRGQATNLDATPFDPGVADPLKAILVVDLSSQFAESQLLISRVYIITAWLVAGLLAVLVFYLILTKLILSPVRVLRETSEKVQAGQLSIRANIQTGDEFEQLSEAFNSMLDRITESQIQLRSMNENLDLKVNELAEANVGLFESNRLKSEFLANVSHELRTPLNSIIGFAELLHDLAEGEDGADPKRERYLANILTSGRSLLEMINELLDMAKIEAGRMEVDVEPTSISDLLEGLAGIMRPQAEAKSIDLVLEIGRNVPVVETDPGKLQQIVYNFVSNAIKFTPRDGTVTIGAERVTRHVNETGVRLSVADTGPGVAEDMHDIIFEKFRQIDASHTREHPGTGLGLAICRDLAELLDATVSFSSEPGRGATFFVDLPQRHQAEKPKPLMG